MDNILFKWLTFLTKAPLTNFNIDPYSKPQLLEIIRA